jgi:hypothetical protein
MANILRGRDLWGVTGKDRSSGLEAWYMPGST